MKESGRRGVEVGGGGEVVCRKHVSSCLEHPRRGTAPRACESTSGQVGSVTANTRSKLPCGPAGAEAARVVVSRAMLPSV